MYKKIHQNGGKILTNTKNVCNLICCTSSISQFSTFKDNSNWNSGHQNHKKECNQDKRTFSIIKQITHSWEGGRADCYPEKFIVNRLRLGWQRISRCNNLHYHPRSYVLFIERHTVKYPFNSLNYYHLSELRIISEWLYLVY